MKTILAWTIGAAAAIGATLLNQLPADAAVVLWLKADSGVLNASSNPAAGGEKVKTWVDQSTGAGGDATQATVASQPTYATGALNGQPVLQFFGTQAAGTQQHLVSTFLSAVSQPYTILLVGQSNGNQATGQPPYGGATDYFYDGAGGSRAVLGLNLNGTGENHLGIYAGAVLETTYARSDWQQYHVYESVYSGSSSAFYIDGSQMTTGSAGGNSIATAGLRIGAYYAGTAHGLNGSVAEMIVLGNASLAERTIADNYLGAKYGIARTNRNVYSGDSGLNGDYDFDVVGIGRESDGAVTSSGSSRGLLLGELSGLDPTDYLLAGHKVTNNAWTTADIPADIAQRWLRAWYVEKTNHLDAYLTFDFGDAGLTYDATQTYELLFSEGSNLDFQAMSLVGTVLGGDQIRFALADANLASGYYTLGMAVPEPGMAALLATGIIGLVGLLACARRNRQ